MKKKPSTVYPQNRVDYAPCLKGGHFYFFLQDVHSLG